MAAFGGGNGETWRRCVGTPFQAETKIPTKIVDLPNPETAIRASAGNPQYNIAWVGYFHTIGMYREGLIETFDVTEFPELANVPEKYLIKAPDGRIIGVPVQFQFYGIAFNTNLARAADFQTWSALTDPKWAGKLAQGQAYIAASYDLVMYNQIAGGNESDLKAGLPNLSAFAKNSMTILSSFAQGNTLLTRGEVTAVPFYSARIRSLKKEGGPVDITIPKEGGLMLPYMLVVPKGAKNRDAYMAFLKYATRPEVQLSMYDFAGYLPLNTSAQLSQAQVTELGMPFKELMKKLYQPDYWKLADTMATNVKMVEEIQGKK